MTRFVVFLALFAAGLALAVGLVAPTVAADSPTTDTGTTSTTETTETSTTVTSTTATTSTTTTTTRTTTTPAKSTWRPAPKRTSSHPVVSTTTTTTSVVVPTTVSTPAPSSTGTSMLGAFTKPARRVCRTLRRRHHLRPHRSAATKPTATTATPVSAGSSGGGPTSPGSSHADAIVLAGFGVAMALFAIGALPAGIIRPRGAALFVVDKRAVVVLAGTALFAAAILALLIGR